MHVGQESTSLSQTVLDNSHVYTAEQPTQVIGPSPMRTNGQTFPTAKETTPHPSEHDTASPQAKQGGSAASKSNCAEAKDNSDSSIQLTTSPEQTTLPTDGVRATSTSEHKEMTIAANDKATQTRIPHQDMAVQTDNLPEAQS